jgi:predicted PurR-regulated permease PerM
MEPRRSEANFFLAILLGVIGLVLLIFFPFRDVIVLALTLAVVFEPLHRWLSRGIRNRAAAAFLAVLIAAAVFAAVVTVVGAQVVRELQNAYGAFAAGGSDALVSQAQQTAAHLQGMLPQSVALGTQVFIAQLSVNISTYANYLVQQVALNIGPLFSGLAGISFTFLLGLIGFYYLLKDGSALEEALVAWIPLPTAVSRRVMDRLHATAHSVVAGSLMAAVLQGVVVGIGLFIFGVPSATIWGLVSIVASLVPIVGILVVVLPAALYLFAAQGLVVAVAFFLWGFVLAGSIDNFVKPRLMKRGAGLHPFIILLSVLGGMAVFGPMGFLIGPLAVSLLTSLLDASALAREAGSEA